MTLNKKYFHIFIIFCLTAIIVSCRKMTPANFWTKFQKDYLIKNNSDQGPWGGHRAMYWKAVDRNTFETKDVLDFASNNGWNLTDSSIVLRDSLKKWNYHGKPIFPLSETGFDMIPTNNSIYRHFPRWIISDIKIYKFKTGWLVYDPSTNESTEENGFVIMNDNSTEMSVYHLWGE